MTARYTLGLDRTATGTHAALIDVRSGATFFSRSDDVELILETNQIEPSQLIGIGRAEDDASRMIASLPGAGVAAPSTIVIRWSHRIDLLMNSRVEASISNLASAGPDLILPGFFGYRASLDVIGDVEEIGFRIRSTCDAMRNAGVPVRRFVCVPVPPLAVLRESIQTLANALGEKIRFVSDEFVIARGAAVLAAIRAGQTDHAHQSQLIHAMAPRSDNERVLRPVLVERRRFDELYRSRFPRGAV